MGMKFNKYNSLENHYQEGFIQKIIEQGLDGKVKFWLRYDDMTQFLHDNDIP